MSLSEHYVKVHTDFEVVNIHIHSELHSIHEVVQPLEESEVFALIARIIY